MIKKIICIYLYIASITLGWSQTSMSFYNLGNTLIQGANFNPSWMPEKGRVIIGLPGISGMHFHVNNKLNYNNIITKESSGNKYYDWNKIISNFQRRNSVTLHSTISLLNVGIRFKSDAVLNLFANERLEVDVFFPIEIGKLAFEGNENSLGEEIKLNKLSIKSTYFREIGVGFATNLGPEIPKLDIGIRGKLLVGFGDLSFPSNYSATMKFDPITWDPEVKFKNVNLRSAGASKLTGNNIDVSHLIFNNNLGFGLDLGATYHISERILVAGSIVDIGFINWKDDISTRFLNDTVFVFRGLNTEKLRDNLRESLTDSLFNSFLPKTMTDSYIGFLPLRVNGSFIYNYTKKTKLYGSFSSRLVQGNIKMLYGVGATKRFGNSFTGSVSLLKLPQQFINLGAALVLKKAGVQFYLAVDQAVAFRLTDVKALDARLGINLIFGERTAWERLLGKQGYKKPKGSTYSYFLGKKLRSKQREGTYSIIKKQNRPFININQPKGKKSTTKNSLPKKKFDKSLEKQIKKH